MGAECGGGGERERESAVGSARRRRYRARLPALSVWGPLLGACSGGAIYFAYNRLVFGGYVPVSGAVKQAWSQRDFRLGGGYDFAENIRAHLQFSVFSDGLLIAAEVCVYAVIVWWASRRASKSTNRLLLPLFMVGALVLALGHAAKFAQHALTMHPDYNAGWYFVPAYLLMALIIPLRCFTAFYLINAWVSPRWPNIGRLLAGATVGATVIVLAATVDFSAPFRETDETLRHTDRGWERTSYLGTQIMNRLLPADAVVGAWDAGIIGYFAAVPVVNLDGLVNSYDHYRHYDERRFGITHYANNTMNSTQQAGALFEGVGFTTPAPGPLTSPEGRNLIQLNFKLWRPNPAAMAAGPAPVQRLRAVLQEQGDYYSDGAAALVSANLVQIFDFNCASRSPEAWLLAVAEKFPDGAENEDGGKLLYFWGDLRRNNLGYCVAAFELPNNTAHPVAVTMQPFAAAINALLAGLTPIVQSDWAVYRIGRQLLYHRAPCAPADTTAQFYLNLIPANDNDLASWQRELGYVSRDFEFDAAGGVRHAGQCAVPARLPGYALSGIRTGQFVPATGPLWGSEFYTADYRAAQASALAASVTGAPAAPGYFSVYHDAGRLTYLREECALADTEASFYLHLVPADLAGLPAARREHGFDNHDFNFGWMGGVRHAGRCLVSVPLPDYAIAHIRTGQHTPDAGALWSSEFYTAGYRASQMSRLAAAATGVPAAPGFFRVYHAAGALTYDRYGCDAADTVPPFFLHIIPADPGSLPAAQREYGFDNLDFEFGAAGGVEYDGRCRVSVPLPDYAIERIRTGQYTPDAGRLWAADFEVEQER